jgi:hypothetical protein
MQKHGGKYSYLSYLRRCVPNVVVCGEFYHGT